MYLKRYVLVATILGVAATGGAVLARGGAGVTPAQAAAPARGVHTTVAQGLARAAGPKKSVPTKTVVAKRGTARSIKNAGTTKAVHSVRGAGPGFGRHGGDVGGPGGFDEGRGLTVTGVNGNTITATSWGSQTVTVTVSATTVYTEAGGAASLADVTAGAHIAVQGTQDSAGALSATGVTIILPTVQGIVTKLGSTSLTVTDFDGTAHVVNLASTTRYARAGQTAALSDIAVGSAVVAEGTSANGTLTAVRVTIEVARLSGQVTAVNGSSYTVTSSHGMTKTYTVTTSGGTAYVDATGATTTTTTLTTGMTVEAEGLLSADGTTLAALRVAILPAEGAEAGGPDGSPEGHGGGHGGHGGGPGGFGGDGTAPTAPGTAPATSSGSI